MNANELADKIEYARTQYDCIKWASDAPDMLRQQADRIAELEKLVSQRFDDGKRLGIIETEDRLLKAKTLTDEEITQVFDECYPNNADGDVVTLIDFARAILRKAQEK
jgi:hypothetical protein